MNASTRGIIIFIGILIFVPLFCFLIPFVWMPAAGNAMALPVIQVPGEVFEAGSPSPDFELTNTIIGTLLADVIVILLALLLAWRSRGWTKEVPGRFQALGEVFAEGLYNFVKGMAGTGTKIKNWLFPLVASIFIFLLVANWLELVPGVDSIGVLHCAGHYGDQNGYPRQDTRFLFWDATALRNDRTLFPGYTANEDDYHTCEEALEGHAVSAEPRTAESIALAASEGKAFGTTYVVETGDTLDSIAALDGAEIDAATIAEINGIEGDPVEGTEIFISDPQLFGRFTDNPDDQIFVVTPYVRAAATDLNLTLGLAIISFMAIQLFGLTSLGTNYIQKFINVRALGNLGKRPLGAVDFLVGLFEIISEFSKLISLAFRLFGNIFAGQLLLFIMAFLVATLLPVIFYGLEFIVGLIQALVFAVLTLVFSAQAMEDHSHHDEEH